MTKKYEWGSKRDIAAAVGKSETSIINWSKSKKYAWIFKKHSKRHPKVKGRRLYNITKTVEEIEKLRSVAHETSQQRRWDAKKGTTATGQEPVSDTEIEKAQKEIGDDEIESMVYPEAQRRKMIEDFLSARIKRKKEEGELIEREAAEQEWTQHIIAAKTKILSIKSRTANILSDYIQDKTVLHSALSAIDECVREALTELAEGGDRDE